MSNYIMPDQARVSLCVKRCHAALCFAEQVVRSALQTEKGKEVVMFWYLEAIEMPERPHGLFGELLHPRHNIPLVFLSPTPLVASILLLA